METIPLFSLLFFEFNSSCLYRCNIKWPVKEFPGVGFVFPCLQRTQAQQFSCDGLVPTLV